MLSCGPTLVLSIRRGKRGSPGPHEAAQSARSAPGQPDSRPERSLEAVRRAEAELPAPEAEGRDAFGLRPPGPEGCAIRAIHRGVSFT